MCLLQQGLSDAIKISYKWWNKTEKNMQAWVNQEIRKLQKIDIFLLFQVLWCRRNTIVTIVSCWWSSFFYSHHGHWRFYQWCSQPKTLGEKCLTSGKQHHFCLGRRFSKHKITRSAKIWSAWTPWLPWLHLWVLHCLFFMRSLHTQLVFYIISRIYVYFSKSGISNTTRA